MKRGSYKKKIIAQMQEAGTYKPCFDNAIEDLAFILETSSVIPNAFEM